MHFDIYKAGGILLKDRTMLVERSRGKEIYLAPGGKVEQDETPEQTVIRELGEEVGITVTAEQLDFFGTFYAPAATHPDQTIRMDVFVVQNWEGDPKPGAEVQELRWITSTIPAGIYVGSIFAHEVIPRLKERDLID